MGLITLELCSSIGFYVKVSILETQIASITTFSTSEVRFEFSFLCAEPFKTFKFLLNIQLASVGQIFIANILEIYLSQV